MGASYTKWLVFFSSVFFSFTHAAHADNTLGLKASKVLGKARAEATIAKSGSVKNESLLGKVGLFRGVSVDVDQVAIPAESRFSINLDESSESAKSMINTVYGGLQISLQENLSLVYAPGKLSNHTLNGESQGVYLLSNRGGPANWFMGIESSAYSNAADSRRTSNSAQFGVIMNLD
ncbi:MAG: hypothetical protein RLO04_08080 [Limnobacter sp.]|uniref:hypothetical protein n=1 Tax=Limnobacter sp. TaxID=2003368 RepID=UPI0032F035E8